MDEDPSQPRRIVKHLLVFLLLFLTGGAIVNVALAWGLVLRDFSAGRSTTRVPNQADQEWWRAHVPDEFPDAPVAVFESRRFGSRSMLYRETELAGPATQYYLLRHQLGWPALSLERASWLNRSARTGDYFYDINYTGWPFTSGTGALFPLRPMWPGFAISTIVYAAILWMMYFVLSVLRHKRRLKRGLCIHCAYDLRGAPPDSPNCPECGKPRTRLES